MLHLEYSFTQSINMEFVVHMTHRKFRLLLKSEQCEISVLLWLSSSKVSQKMKLPTHDVKYVWQIVLILISKCGPHAQSRTKTVNLFSRNIFVLFNIGAAEWSCTRLGNDRNICKKKTTKLVCCQTQSKVIRFRRQNHKEPLRHWHTQTHTQTICLRRLSFCHTQFLFKQHYLLHHWANRKEQRQDSLTHTHTHTHIQE